MKKHSIALAVALLFTLPGSAWAAVVEVARLSERYADLSWWSSWLGTSIWECDVP